MPWTPAAKLKCGVTRSELRSLRVSFERLIGATVSENLPDRREAKFLAESCGSTSAIAFLLAFRPLHECASLAELDIELLDDATLQGLRPAGHQGRTPLYT